MIDFKETPLTVQTQGRVRVNFAYEYLRNPDVVLVDIDLHTKYADVSGYSETGSGAPEIYLNAGGNAIHVDESTNDETTISLDAFAGYDIFTADVKRYTLRVAMVRKST